MYVWGILDAVATRLQRPFTDGTPLAIDAIHLLVATNAAGREHFIAFWPKRRKNYKVHAPCFRMVITYRSEGPDHSVLPKPLEV